MDNQQIGFADPQYARFSPVVWWLLAYVVLMFFVIYEFGTGRTTGGGLDLTWPVLGIITMLYGIVLSIIISIRRISPRNQIVSSVTMLVLSIVVVSVSTPGDDSIILNPGFYIFCLPPALPLIVGLVRKFK